LFSPIHTLPVELLAEIFDLAIRNDDDEHVCSYWRQIAHSTPKLWTRPLEVDLRQYTGGGKAQVHLDGLKTWLLRSAPLAAPVSLVLEHRNTSPSMLDEVLSTAPRWRSLRLYVWDLDYTPAVLSFVIRLAEARLDNLEELDLGTRDLEEEETPTFPSLTTAHRLRKLRIHIGLDALPFLMPWAQLTDLTLNSRFPNIALDILSQCTNLIRATVQTTGWAVLPEAKRDIFVLRHLRALSLSFFGSAGHVIPALECMSAPALEELHLDFGDMRANVACWTEARFTTVQSRAPHITHLELQYSYLTSSDLRTAIHNAPSLTTCK
ncbi:hypothetical protein C8R45DRAFT_845896, partial [Mycena sanguinolenta]